MIGKKVKFNYPEAFSEIDGHKGHSGQVVKVTAEGPDFTAHSADGDPLWAIKAADGWEGLAWESELEEIT